MSATAAANALSSDDDLDINGAILLSSSSDDGDREQERRSSPGMPSVANRVKSRKRKSFAATAAAAATAPAAAAARMTRKQTRKTKRCSLEEVNRRAMAEEILPALDGEAQEGGSNRSSRGRARVSSMTLRSSTSRYKLRHSSDEEQEEEQVPSPKSSDEVDEELDSDGLVVVLDSSEEEEDDPAEKPSSGIKAEKEDSKKVGRSSRSKSKSKPRKRFGPRKQPSPPPPVDDEFAQEPVLVESDDDEGDDPFSAAPYVFCPRKGRSKLPVSSNFVGKPIPTAQAKKRWPDRFHKEPGDVEHYEEAVVDGIRYRLGDCVAINGEDSEYIGKVLEFFANQENFFRVQWFFRFRDTAIGNLEDVYLDEKRLFLSADEDDNNIECIIRKVQVLCAPLLDTFSKPSSHTNCDYYYDMCYANDFSTFHKVSSDNDRKPAGSKKINASFERELTLLDLYSGCGAMSTGLSMGAALGGIKLETKWAVDYNEHACNSMKLNHPEAEVRNGDAECFLLLLKEWEKLCTKYEGYAAYEDVNADLSDSSTYSGDGYEVEQVVGIRMAETESRRPDTSSKMPEKPIKRRLEFKVRWKGYTSDDDTWEPISHLESCEERIRDFVLEGKRRRVLPLPGDVDVVCGGPPCQGASGYNRFRNTEAPLNCPRNRQMMIYMDIVDFLRPKFVLMENVVDILKFSQGILGRFALFRLVDMRYQAKLGMMAAGSYGLPQFRMRVFLWGAAPTEELPAFPLPTHETIFRGNIPNQFSQNLVKHTGDKQLEKALILEDAISDLPPVGNFESRDDMPYKTEPRTQFQERIRSARNVFYGRGQKGMHSILHDHRPLQLNADDYQRSCRIPKRKGGNFRDLGGLIIKEDNSVALDPTVKREYLPSGKPLIPDYAISFIKGRSTRPFARMWWDEIVPTVITRPQPHNHRMLHPTQDRVLTIRENARLQGFPDWYKLTGTVKERYMQVGNAVAVPVARALGYSLALTKQRLCIEPRLLLPANFPELEAEDRGGGRRNRR